MSMVFPGGYTSDDDRSFAVAVTMGERGWRVVDLGDDATDSLADVAQALRNLRSERVAVGMLSVDGDYSIFVCQGVGPLRVAFSNVTTAVTDGIVVNVFDGLDLDILDPDKDEPNDVDAWAEGDMDILAGLDCSEEVLESICDDQLLRASEQPLAITEELGCTEELVDTTDLDYDGDDDDYGPYDD